MLGYDLEELDIEIRIGGQPILINNKPLTIRIAPTKKVANEAGSQTTLFDVAVGQKKEMSEAVRQVTPSMRYILERYTTLSLTKLDAIPYSIAGSLIGRIKQQQEIDGKKNTYIVTRKNEDITLTLYKPETKKEEKQQENTSDTPYKNAAGEVLPFEQEAPAGVVTSPIAIGVKHKLATYKKSHCSMQGCHQKVYTKGLCSKHYQLQRKTTRKQTSSVTM
jgi:hypothetical protein